MPPDGGPRVSAYLGMNADSWFASSLGVRATARSLQSIRRNTKCCRSIATMSKSSSAFGSQSVRNLETRESHHIGPLHGGVNVRGRAIAERPGAGTIGRRQRDHRPWATADRTRGGEQAGPAAAAWPEVCRTNCRRTFLWHGPIVGGIVCTCARLRSVLSYGWLSGRAVPTNVLPQMFR